MDFANEKDQAEHANGMGGAPLRPQQTTGSIVLTPEMFERMYAAPYSKVKGDLRTTFGNPTPVGLGGFLLAYCPLIINFLGWRGASGGGAATVGTFYFMGGLLAILACIGEWVIGNSFPSTFFGVYGGYFLYFGATLTPFFNAAGHYEMMGAPAGTGSVSPGFLASSAYVSLFMGLFSLYSTICALRVNVLFVLAFGLLTVTFGVVGAGQFYGAEGDLEKYQNYIIAGGAVGFPVLVIGWYLMLVIMLSTVDFPLSLPTGDLSTVIKSRTELEKAKKARQNGTSNGA